VRATPRAALAVGPTSLPLRQSPGGAFGQAARRIRGRFLTIASPRRAAPVREPATRARDRVRRDERKPAHRRPGVATAIAAGQTCRGRARDHRQGRARSAGGGRGNSAQPGRAQRRTRPRGGTVGCCADGVGLACRITAGPLARNNPWHVRGRTRGGAAEENARKRPAGRGLLRRMGRSGRRMPELNAWTLSETSWLPAGATQQSQSTGVCPTPPLAGAHRGPRVGTSGGYPPPKGKRVDGDTLPACSAVAAAR